ncbi:MAG: hypothetical protein FWC53_03035 [Firmicutes bacterium]|nr:hypothetical protein [Bacillota bacterium]
MIKTEENLRADLLKRSIAILEKTKTNFKNYEKERHTLLDFTEDPSPDYSLWEHMVKGFECVIELDNKLNFKKEDLLYLSKLSADLKEQRVKEGFEDGKFYVFGLYNHLNDVLEFMTRTNATSYAKSHPVEFKNTIINITPSQNNDLNRLLEIIERNF